VPPFRRRIYRMLIRGPFVPAMLWLSDSDPEKISRVEVFEHCTTLIANGQERNIRSLLEPILPDLSEATCAKEQAAAVDRIFSAQPTP
jgi:hypothetical protein